ncbi:MAG: hypothetical protein IT378_19645 [Sandaracinaceae bacterium]|nr:hypothetical protein [Sandaracinaceae bacterium]
MPLASPESLPSSVARLAMVARWKPVHVGHAAVLEALVARAEHVTIGIGSSNRYDVRNPFTAAESAAMIHAIVGERAIAEGKVELVEVPDLGHGPRWRAMVVELLGPLDLFVTANAYVRDLLAADYLIAHPVWLVAPERRVRVDGTTVRRAMAQGGDWRALVPPAVAAYLDESNLVDRFVREFGPATLEAV